MPFPARVPPPARVVYVCSSNPAKVKAVLAAMQRCFPEQHVHIQGKGKPGTATLPAPATLTCTANDCWGSTAMLTSATILPAAVPSQSGVPDQPVGEQQTKQGALNRVKYIRRHLQQQQTAETLAAAAVVADIARKPRQHEAETLQSRWLYYLQTKQQQQQQQQQEPLLQHCEQQQQLQQQGGQQQQQQVAYQPLLVAVEGGVRWQGAKDLTCFAWAAVQRLAADAGEARVSLARSAEFVLPAALAELVASGMELGAADDQVFGRQCSGHGSGTVGYLTNGLISRQAYYEHAVVLALVPYLQQDLYPGY